MAKRASVVSGDKSISCRGRRQGRPHASQRVSISLLKHGIESCMITPGALGSSRQSSSLWIRNRGIIRSPAVFPKLQTIHSRRCLRRSGCHRWSFDSLVEKSRLRITRGVIPVPLFACLFFTGSARIPVRARMQRGEREEWKTARAHIFEAVAYFPHRFMERSTKSPAKN